VVTSKSFGVVRIVMDRSFDLWQTQEIQASFVRDLEDLTGVPRTELTLIAVRSGCVVAEFRMPEEAIKTLISLFEFAPDMEDPNGVGPDQMAVAKEFFARHSVTAIRDDYVVKLVISKTPEGPDGIVLVHGWSGNRASFGVMPKALSELVKADVKVYEYQSERFGKSPRLTWVARNLDTSIRNENLDKGRLAIVAHSMGGLVARKLVTDQRRRLDRLDRNLRLLALVASPYFGHPLAHIGKRFAPKSRQLGDLDPQSDFMSELASDWLAWRRMEGVAVAVRSILGEADDFVKPYMAQGDDPNPIVLLGRGHSDIVEVEEPGDEVVVTLVRLLLEAGFVARE